MLYSILRFIVKILFRIIYRIEVLGKDNIPKDGKSIICANHIHLFDPVLITTIFPDQIHWMGKKELFNIKILNYVFTKLGAFGVDREFGITGLRHSMKLLDDDKIIGIFPEGTRVKGLDYENAKPGVALLSIRSKTPIIPVYIEASYRPFSRIKVVIGEEINLNEEGRQRLKSEDYKEYGEKVLYKIYKLKEQI